MKDSYKEIRAMLERWYAGDADPELTRRIAAVLAVHDGLPADLAMEREIFLAMQEAACAPVEVPEEYSTRIDLALETEIRGAGMCEAETYLAEMLGEGTSGEEANGGAMKELRKSRGKFWRSMIGLTAAAASVVLISIYAVRLLNEEGGIGMMQPGIDGVASASVADSASAHGEQSIPATINENVAERLAATLTPEGSGIRENSPAAATARVNVGATKPAAPANVKIYGSRKSTDMPATDGSMAKNAAGSAASDSVAPVKPSGRRDYDEYIAANYRVVENEAEATAIINNIFACLDTRIAEESSRVTEISLNYDARKSGLTEL